MKQKQLIDLHQKLTEDMNNDPLSNRCHYEHLLLALKRLMESRGPTPELYEYQKPQTPKQEPVPYDLTFGASSKMPSKLLQFNSNFVDVSEIAAIFNSPDSKGQQFWTLWLKNGTPPIALSREDGESLISSIKIFNACDL